MLHACVRIFDVTGTVENFWGTKQRWLLSFQILDSLRERDDYQQSVPAVICFVSGRFRCRRPSSVCDCAWMVTPRVGAKFAHCQSDPNL